jgi:hypothetical protein
MVTEQSAKEQENWLISKGKELEQKETEEDNIIVAQGKVLYEVWSVWDASNNDDKKSLTNEAKWAWGYDFYAWAKAYTKRRAGREPAKETIDNKITIYRDYIALQLIEAPAVVYIPKRNEFGKLVDPLLEDENAWEEIEPDFANVDYGKMLVARGSARRREMTPDAWSALFDPYASVNTLKEALGHVQKRQHEEDNDFYLVEEEGIIYGCCNGTKKAVFQVLFENDEGDDLFHRTLCHVLKAIGVHVPLTYQPK